MYHSTSDSTDWYATEWDVLEMSWKIMGQNLFVMGSEIYFVEIRPNFFYSKNVRSVPYVKSVSLEHRKKENEFFDLREEGLRNYFITNITWLINIYPRTNWPTRYSFIPLEIVSGHAPFYLRSNIK